MPVTIVMTITTLYALFGDDIRVLSTDKVQDLSFIYHKNGDAVFYGFHIIAMSLFSIEIVLASLCRPQYIFGFFFWLDVVSTLTILLDIGWFADQLFGNSSGVNAASAA
jgi:hypothetical protein